MSFDNYIVGMLIDARNVHLYLLFLLLGAKASFTPFKATPAMKRYEPTLRDDQYVFISTCQVEMLNTEFTYFPSMPPLQDSSSPTDHIQNGLFRSDTPERYVNFVKLSGDLIVRCCRIILQLTWLPEFGDPLDITNFTTHKGVSSFKMSAKDQSLISEFLNVSKTTDAQLKSALHQRCLLPKSTFTVVDLLSPPIWSANPRYLSAPPVSHRGTLRYAILFTCLSGDLHLEWNNGNCIINVGGITIFLGSVVSSTGINLMLNTINIPMPPTSGGKKMPNQFSIGSSIFCWSYGDFAEQSQVIVRVDGPPVGIRDDSPALTHLSKLVRPEHYVTGQRIYFAPFFPPYQENSTKTNARVVGNIVATSSPGATVTAVYLVHPDLPTCDDSEYFHFTFQGVVLVTDEQVFPIIDGLSVPPYSKFHMNHRDGTTKFIGNNGRECYHEVIPVSARLDCDTWSYRVKKLGPITLDVSGYEQKKTQTGFVPLVLHLVKKMVDDQGFFNPVGLSNAITSFLNSMKGTVVSTTWGLNQRAVITPCRDVYHPAAVQNPFVSMLGRGNLVIDNAEPLLGHLVHLSVGIQFVSAGRVLVTFVSKSPESTSIIEVRGKTAFVDPQVISYLEHVIKMKHPVHNGKFLVYQLNDANIAVSTAACILAFMFSGQAIFSKMSLDNEKMAEVNSWVYDNFVSSLPIMKVVMATSNVKVPIACLYRAKDTLCKKPIQTSKNFSQYQKLTIDGKLCRILITKVVPLVPKCIVTVPEIVTVPIAFSKLLNPTRFAQPLLVGNAFELGCSKCGMMTKTTHVVHGCPNENTEGLPCFRQTNSSLNQNDRLYVGATVPIDCYTFVELSCKENTLNFNFPFKCVVSSHSSPGSAQIASGCFFYKDFNSFFRSMILKHRGNNISKLLNIFGGTVSFDRIVNVLVPNGDKKAKDEAIKDYLHPLRTIRCSQSFRFVSSKVIIHRRLIPRGLAPKNPSSLTNVATPVSTLNVSGQKVNVVLKELFKAKSRRLPTVLDFSNISNDLAFGTSDDNEYSETSCNKYFSTGGSYETIVADAKSVPHKCIMIDFKKITMNRHTDNSCDKCFSCIFKEEPYFLCFVCKGIPVITVNVAFTCHRIPMSIMFGSRRQRKAFGVLPALVCLPINFGSTVALNQFVQNHNGTVVVVADGESVQFVPQNARDKKLLVSDSLLIDKPLDSHEYGEAVLCKLDSGENLLLRCVTKEQFFTDSQSFASSTPTGQHWSFAITKPKVIKSLDGSPEDALFYHYTNDKKIVLCEGAIPKNLVSSDYYSTLFIRGYDGFCPNPALPCKKDLTVPHNIEPDFKSPPNAIIGGYRKLTKNTSVCSHCKIPGLFDGDCSYHTSPACETPNYYLVDMYVYRLTLVPISGAFDEEEETPITGWTLCINREHPYQHVVAASVMKTLDLDATDASGNALVPSNSYGSLVFFSKTIRIHGHSVVGPVVSDVQRTKCINVPKNDTPTSGTSFRLHKSDGVIKIYVGKESDFENLTYIEKPSDKHLTITANVAMVGHSHVIDTDHFKGTVSLSVLFLLEQFSTNNSIDYCSIVNACVVCDPTVVTTQRGKGTVSFGEYTYKKQLIQTVPGKSLKPTDSYSIVQSDHLNANQLASSFALPSLSSFNETASLLISEDTALDWDRKPPSQFDKVTLIVNSRITGIASGKTLEAHVLSMYCKPCGSFHKQKEGGNTILDESCIEADSNIFGTSYGVTIVVDGFFIDLKFKDGTKYNVCKICQVVKPTNRVIIDSYRARQTEGGKWKNYVCGTFKSPVSLSNARSSGTNVCRCISTDYDGIFSFIIEKYLKDIYVRNPDKSSSNLFLKTGNQRARSGLTDKLNFYKSELPQGPPVREESDDEDLQPSMGFFNVNTGSRSDYNELINDGSEFDFSD